MTISNHQPYLFPYLGYWQLINLSDIFVIADNMQYIKKGYVNRNRMLIHGTAHLFTLEVLRAATATPINEMYIGNNAKTLLKSFFFAYKKAPYFNDVYPILEQILLNDAPNLALFLGNSIETISHYLDINTELIYESSLNADYTQGAQAGIIDICKTFRATRYINAVGGQELYDKSVFKSNGIELQFLQMGTVQYRQFNQPFVPNLSIIDILMFNSKQSVRTMLTQYTLL